MTLAEAREAAAVIRKQARAGLDPLAEKRRARERIPTFREAAAIVHAENKRGWKNGKHQGQWLATLEAYAFPTLGELMVDRIETGHVRDVLGPIRLDKPETARRVRQRMGAVLDYAVAKGWRAHPLAMTAVGKALPRQPAGMDGSRPCRSPTYPRSRPNCASGRVWGGSPSTRR